MSVPQRRTVISEERVRSFSRGGHHYRIVVRWQILNDGTKFHYVHVFRGSSQLPFRWWRWSTTADNEFIEWA